MEPHRNFRKRSAILDCLRKTDAHPSAEMLHAMLRQEHPDISLATVYRNLSLFKDQGLIQSLGTVQGVERFDANIAPHVHFVCGSCSAVLDLTQMEVPQALCREAAQSSGCEIAGCSLTFTGTCRECLAKQKPA